MEDKKERRMRIALCLPTYHQVPTVFFDNTLRIVGALMRRGMDVRVKIEPNLYIDDGRNKLVEWALKEDVDLIWFIDSDNMVADGILERLILTMEESGAEVVSALYFEKGKPYYPVLRNYLPEGDIWLKIDNLEIGAILPVDGIGMGCCIIKPSVFPRIPRPWFKTDYVERNGEQEYRGEDLTFSKKLVEAKIKTVCDTSAISPHLGSMVDMYEFEHFRGLRADVAQDRDELLEDIISFFGGLSKGKALSKIWSGTHELKKEWTEKNPKTHAEILAFYKTTQNYIFDLAAWHFGQRRQFDMELVESCRRAGRKRILDVGAGIGQNSLMLARAGFDVTLAELGGRTFDFAKARFKARGIKASFWTLDSDEKPPTEKFDTILMLDLLEHLDDQSAEELINRIILLKSEDCKVVLTTNFQESGDYPMHFQQSEKMRELIKKLLEPKNGP